MDEGSPDGLGRTARWAAAVRARESARPDRLFDDPWADALAGEQGRAWAASRPVESLAPMVLRTRYYDDYAHRLAAGGIAQVVLLAAGLDTRAFRMGWPAGTALFELDRPDVLRAKQRVLDAAGARPRCARHVCAADLSLPGWPDLLTAAGFDPSSPSVWLAEGFLFYLEPAALTALLARVSDLAAPGSGLGADVVNARLLTHELTAAWVRMQADAGAPWVGTLDDPEGFLGRLGWRATLSQCGEPDADHGRWPYPRIPLTVPGLPHHWLVSATKLR